MVFDTHASNDAVSTDALAFDAEPSVSRLSPARVLRPQPRKVEQPAARSGLATGRRTLKNAISCSGIGLHTGTQVSMTLHPAPAGTGILFHRTGTGIDARIPATWTHVRDSQQCTVIGDDAGTIVGTIEHLMAATSAMDIDDLVVEINGPEVPAMDGSSGPFVFLIECAGTVTLDAPRTAIRILEPVSVSHNGATATLSPRAPGAPDGLSVSFEIEFAAAAIGRQAASVTLSPATFKDQISRARTFGLIDDLPRMRAAGLAKGGSLDNAVVVNGAEVLNEGGLRYPDEFVRHKILDAIGDLALAGRPIIGTYSGKRASHALNTALLQALFARPSAWVEDVLDEAEDDLLPVARTAPAA